MIEMATAEMPWAEMGWDNEVAAVFHIARYVHTPLSIQQVPWRLSGMRASCSISNRSNCHSDPSKQRCPVMMLGWVVIGDGVTGFFGGLGWYLGWL